MTQAQPIPVHVERFQIVDFRRVQTVGVTRSIRVVVRDEAGSPHEAILKLRFPDAEGPDFGPTSLACELISAVLARHLQLNVPRFGIGEFGPVFASSPMNEEASKRLQRNIGENFISIAIRPQPLDWDPRCTSLSFELRQALDDVLSFDASIINGDRRAANPNLLWDGGDSVWVIDHGLACGAHRFDDATFAESPLLPPELVKAHCAFGFLFGRGQKFEELIERWTIACTDEFWAGVQAAIPATWETNRGDIARVCTFLQQRVRRLADVSAGLRSTVR